MKRFVRSPLPQAGDFSVETLPGHCLQHACCRLETSRNRVLNLGTFLKMDFKFLDRHPSRQVCSPAEMEQGLSPCCLFSPRYSLQTAFVPRSTGTQFRNKTCFQGYKKCRPGWSAEPSGFFFVEKPPGRSMTARGGRWSSGSGLSCDSCPNAWPYFLSISRNREVTRVLLIMASIWAWVN